MRRIFGKCLPCVIVVALSKLAFASSTAEPAWYGFFPDLSDGPVTLSLHSIDAGIQGWSVGVCHDPAAAQLVNFAPTDRLLTVRDGGPPSFLSLEEGAKEGFSGVTQAVVLDFTQHRVLPIDSGQGFEILKLTYDVLEEMTLSTCKGLVGSGEPVNELITIDGASFHPTAPATTTLVPKPEAWFDLVPEVSDEHVVASIHSENGGIQGWSMSLCHDPSKVSVKRYQASEELLTLNHGGVPDYFFMEETLDGDRAGIIQAVVPAFKEYVPIPGETEGGFPVLEVDYDVAQESTITFCHALRGSGQPVRLVVTIGGYTSRLPKQHAETTLVVDHYGETLSYTVEPAVTNGVATVKLTSEVAALRGWSFALCHEAGKARVIQMQSAPELEELLEGEPPEFVLNEIRELDPFVAVTQEVVLGSPLDPVAAGPFPDGLPVLGIRYDVFEEDTLKFCDSVGSIQLANKVVIDGLGFIPRTRTGALLVTGDLGTKFIRGDADLSGELELTDAVFVLTALFLGGEQPPCLDAADTNDVAIVDISDPIYALQFLYMGGPQPPPPFPEPGTELSPGTALGCERGL